MTRSGLSDIRAAYEARQLEVDRQQLVEAARDARKLEAELQAAREWLATTAGRLIVEGGWPLELAATEAGVSVEVASRWAALYVEWRSSRCEGSG